MNVNEARELLKIKANEMAELSKMPIEDIALAEIFVIIKKAASLGKNKICLDYYLPKYSDGTISQRR